MLAILGGVGAAFAGGRRRACTGSAAELRPAGRVDPAPGAPGGRARGRPLPLVVAGRLTLTRAALPFVLVSGVCEVLGFVSYTVGAYLVLYERLAPHQRRGSPRSSRASRC
jgi:hypothetical protein